MKDSASRFEVGLDWLVTLLLSGLAATSLQMSLQAGSQLSPPTEAREGGAFAWVFIAITGALALWTWWKRWPEFSKEHLARTREPLARLAPGLLFYFGALWVSSSLAANLVPELSAPRQYWLESGAARIELNARAELSESTKIDEPAILETLKASLKPARVLAGALAIEPGPAPWLLDGEALTQRRILRNNQVLALAGREWRYHDAVPKPRSVLAATLLAKLMTVLLFALLLWPFARLRSETLLAGLGFDVETARAEVLRGLRWYLALLPLLLLLTLLVKTLGTGLGLQPIPHPIEASLQSGDPLALALAYGSAALLAPLDEELLFRGIILLQLSPLLGPRLAIALAAGIFASMHPGFHAFVPIFALGVFFGALTLSAPKNSLVASFAAHLAHNSLVLGLFILGIF